MLCRIIFKSCILLIQTENERAVQLLRKSLIPESFQPGGQDDLLFPPFD